MVQCCIDTVEVILSDWRDTGARMTENEKSGHIKDQYRHKSYKEAMQISYVTNKATCVQLLNSYFSLGILFH